MGAEGSGLAPEVWGARGQHPRPSSQGRVPAPPGSTYSRISCLLRNVSSCGESAGQPWGRGTPRSRPVPHSRCPRTWYSPSVSRGSRLAEPPMAARAASASHVTLPLPRQRPAPGRDRPAPPPPFRGGD